MSISVNRLPLVLLLLALCGAVSAQTPKDNIVLYAKAGRINHATGSSQIRRTLNGPAKAMVMGEDLTIGDIVQTGADSQVELLLNPGSYLRVADNSQFQITSSSLRGIRIFLRRGSVVIENGSNPSEFFSIQILTPLGMAFFENPGIYRVNVSPEAAEYRSLFGEFTLGSRTVDLTSGQHVKVDRTGVGPIASFDAKVPEDSLESWSRSRADALAKANRKLDGHSLAFAIKGAEGDKELNVLLQGLSGVWANSSLHGFTVFVPFYPKYWRSPYGFDYTNGNSRMQLAERNSNIPASRGWPAPAASGMPAGQEPARVGRPPAEQGQPRRPRGL